MMYLHTLSRSVSLSFARSLLLSHAHAHVRARSLSISLPPPPPLSLSLCACHDQPFSHPRLLHDYVVATISRLLKVTGFFGKRTLYKRRYSAIETYNFKEPTNRSHLICIAMGWLQLVGSLKLWVSFAEYRLFYRALLQKRPVMLRSLLIVATP